MHYRAIEKTFFLLPSKQAYFSVKIQVRKWVNTKIGTYGLVNTYGRLSLIYPILITIECIFDL